MVEYFLQNLRLEKLRSASVCSQEPVRNLNFC